MSNKFTTAEFFNAALGEIQEITPDNYNPDIHEGRIQCTAKDCEASLIHVPNYMSNGFNTSVSSHFKKNSHGEPHAPTCSFAPELDHERILKMQEALTQNKTILLNVNFLTSFKRSILPDYFANKAMQSIDGEIRDKWIKDNKGEYAPFSLSDIDKVSTRLREYKIASQNLGKHADTNQLTISYLHGAFPWSSFYSNETKGSITASKTQACSKDIFEILYNEITPEKDAKRLWRPSPVLKMNISPWAKYAKDGRVPTHTPSENRIITIEDNEFKVQDVLEVRNASLLSKIKNASSISFVSTPFIDPKAVQKQVKDNKGFVHLNWAIGDENQVIFD